MWEIIKNCSHRILISIMPVINIFNILSKYELLLTFQLVLEKLLVSYCWCFKQNKIIVLFLSSGESSWSCILTFTHVFPPEYLKVRSHDPEEAIRHDVIVSIVTAAKKDLLLVNDHLLNFVRERTLDKRVRHN